METYDIGIITADDFRNHLNQNVAVHFNPGIPVAVEILEVENLEIYSGLDRLSFSVILRMNGEKGHYPQGIYVVEHPKLGRIEIFLVPIGTDKEGMRYQSVFS